jgi:TetR/AcrR family transcriptional regulator, regulator of autoinduction and epiphytic fitness
MADTAAPAHRSNGTAPAADPESDTDILDDIEDLEDVDGRSMRRRRNRNAVIAALISLIREGDLDPTVAKIADRAEVSHRSIFRYFDDLNDLARTAVETEFRAVWPVSVIPDVGQGSLEHRIRQYVEAQVRLLQRTHSLGRVARSKSIAIPEIDRGLTNVLELRIDQARRQFDPELSRMSEPDRESTVTAIVVLVGFEGFDLQRRMLGASVDEVIAVWRHGVHKLLA